jgi:rod shape-determining protein MreD
MKITTIVFWLFILFLVQMSFAATWGIDLPIIFISLFGLRTTAVKAAGMGAFLGLAQDMLSVGTIGPNMAAKIVCALLSVSAQGKIYREKVPTQTLLIFVNILIQQIIVWLLMKWDRSPLTPRDAFWVTLPSVLFTTLMGMVVCFFVVRFRRRRFDPATA